MRLNGNAFLKPNMTFWKDKSVLVTGGCGFIGSRLVERLVEAGAKVAVVDDVKRGKWENLAAVKDQIEVVVADLLNEVNARQRVGDAMLSCISRPNSGRGL